MSPRGKLAPSRGRARAAAAARETPGRILRNSRLVACLVAGLLLAVPLWGSPAANSRNAVAHAPASAPGGDRILALVNRTRATIWPAAWPGSVSGRTGWTLPAGGSVSITVPDRWNARLWGRSGCHFEGGRGHCQTGDCEGLYQRRGW